MKNSKKMYFNTFYLTLKITSSDESTKSCIGELRVLLEREIYLCVL